MHEDMFKLLTSRGFCPDNVIDVGAYVGDWTREARPYFPNSKFLMVEALPDKQQAMVSAAQATSSDFEICLLGRGNRESFPFYAMETGSSIFSELTDMPRRLVHIPMHRLDDVVARHNLSGSFFLKLDVQGAELEVLYGAPCCLSKAEVVLLEVALLPYNQGAPDAYEVHAMMHANGFSLFDVPAFYRWPNGLAFQCDFLFVRRDSKLRIR